MCVPAAYLVLVVRPLNILDLKSDQKWLKEKYFFFPMDQTLENPSA